MSFFPSLPADDDLLGLWQQHHRGLEHLLAFHDAVLRGPSAFSEGERELIAAFVSALNGCRFCFAAHRAHAEAWHIDPGVFGEMRIDRNHASLRSAMQPVLSYVETLTLDPHGVTADQVDAIYAAGFDEAALYDLINVIALYAFMNRMVEGSGIKRPSSAKQPRAEVKRRIRYSDIWAAIARQKEKE